MYASSPLELLKTPGNLLKREAPDVAHEQVYTENFRDVKTSNATFASCCMLKILLQNSYKNWVISDVNLQGGEGYQSQYNTQISILPSEKTVQGLDIGEANCKYLEKEPALYCSLTKDVLSNVFSLEVVNCKSSKGIPSEEIHSDTSDDVQSGTLDKETELLQIDQLHLSDCPKELKPVLKGGCEKSSLKPGPKVHVTCVPDVYDLAYAGTSHTVLKEKASTCPGLDSCKTVHNTEETVKYILEYFFFSKTIAAHECSNGECDSEKHSVDSPCCKSDTQISIIPSEEDVQSLELGEANFKSSEGVDSVSSVLIQSDIPEEGQSGTCENKTELLEKDKIQLNDRPKELKSVLRGGHEKSGLGPRPKLHVTWAPEVYDPPCTSTSHTTTRSHRRHSKGEQRSRKSSRKGKGSSHSDSHSHKKSHKKTVRRTKYNLENDIFSNTVVQTHELSHISNLELSAATFEGPALNGAINLEFNQTSNILAYQ